MSSFLSKVINDLLKKQLVYKDLVIVLPSQRACVFFKEELIAALPKSTFLPKIISIELYIQELADINLIDTTQLLFEFYEVYLDFMPNEQIEPFDSFCNWATIALGDFNEVDSYLINSKSFFSNLRDVKKLDEWFPNKKPSKLAENYLLFFEYLNTLYENLYDRLKSNKHGYQGLIYREATENLEFYIENNKSNSYTAFVGFNALNKAEEFIFQELLNNNISTIYWDAHEQFLDSTNEAGTFLRAYKNEWAYYKKNPFLWVDSEQIDQQIKIIGAPKNVTQIKYAGELLSKEKNFNKTALVLADESLLSLALNSLPDNLNKLNITMGYPLSDIPTSGLFEKYFKLHLNQEKYTGLKLDQFYYKDVLNLLNDSFLNKLYGEPLQDLIQKINAENRIFISLDAIEMICKKINFEGSFIISSLFKKAPSIHLIINCCSDLILRIKDNVDAIDKEYLYRLYTVFQQLDTLNNKYQHIKDMKVLYHFYKQILKNEKLAFQGEPLEGLQLMGMLETRALDFDTVIITSLNEGILPGSKNNSSLIPFDIKNYFGIPTYKEKDAIFSYHFQRLIRRAKKVYLLYNTETDGYGSGEKSRFLTQLELKNPSVNTEVISPNVLKFPKLEVNSIDKNDELIEKLKDIFKKGISPSSIATYIYNPISFYEQKILRIDEANEVEETIAANTMGSVMHDVLEELYTPFIGKYVSAQNIKEMFSALERLIQKYFRKHYANGNLTHGKNKLIFEVCKSYLERFLGLELELINQGKPLKIIALEKRLSCDIRLNGIDFPIRINGIVDRIDEVGGVVRVIDYKTGKVEPNQLKTPDFDVISEDYKYTKALQVMLYCYLYSKNAAFDSSKPLQGGIISFKNMKGGFMKMNFSEKRGGKDHEISLDRIHEFMESLEKIIIEILDKNTPINENQNLPF